MKRPRSLLRAAFLTGALCARASVAHAQVDTAGAAAAYQRGVAALHDDHFSVAVTEFEASQRLNPSPQVLYNLALAYRGAGRHVLAVETFERYLREQPTVAADRREAITREVQRLRARIGVISCRVRPSSATLVIDGQERACANAMFIDPGDHAVEVRAEGFRTAQHRVRITPGVELDFRVELVPVEAHAPPHPRAVADARIGADRGERADGDASPLYTRWWFWTIVGVAVAGGVTAGVLLATQPAETPDMGQSVTVEALTTR